MKRRPLCALLCAVLSQPGICAAGPSAPAEAARPKPETAPRHVPSVEPQLARSSVTREEVQTRHTLRILRACDREGLVLHLSFDRQSIRANIARDLSGHGNDGTLHGRPKLVSGRFAESLALDGRDDCVEVALRPSLTFASDDSLTVQAWIRTNDSPEKNEGIVGNYRHATKAFWALTLSGSDRDAARGKVQFVVRDARQTTVTTARSPLSVNDGRWHHLASVRDRASRTIRCYVDGELVDEQPDRKQDVNSGQSIWIGEHLNRFYSGLIDDVKIWNRPLTALEIKKSMLGDDVCRRIRWRVMAASAATTATTARTKPSRRVFPHGRVYHVATCAVQNQTHRAAAAIRRRRGPT